MDERRIDIAFNRQVNAHTWVMGLHSPQIAKTARPGQFVMIRICEALSPLLRRPFSICGVEGSLFLILYRVVGEGTRLMSEFRAGQQVSVLGPLGRGFGIPGPEEAAFPVGGGIGVAPLFFLVQALVERDVVLLAGFPTADDVLLPEMIGLPAVRMGLATEDGSRGVKGFVTDLMQSALNDHQNRNRPPRIYSCGPKPMLAKVAEMIMVRGISCEVSLEAHMACGLGACQGCAVPAASGRERPYYHVCQDGPVFPAEAIDWNNL